jgi:hypothetical protein
MARSALLLHNALLRAWGISDGTCVTVSGDEMARENSGRVGHMDTDLVHSAPNVLAKQIDTDKSTTLILLGPCIIEQG